MYDIMDLMKGENCMNKVTIDKFRTDYCERCIYKEESCCDSYKTACYSVSQDRLNFLASLLYSKPTKVVQGGETNCQ